MAALAPPQPPDATDLAANRLREFEQLPRLSCTEVDYFCDRCGYNLRGQAVRRDPGTGILLMRCPECGAFHPAIGASSIARLWVLRLARTMLLAWVLLAYLTIGLFIGLHVQIVLVVLIRLNRLYRPLPMGERDIGEFWKLIGGGLALSITLGLVAAALCALVFPHWKRWSLAIAGAAWPVLSLIVTIYAADQFAWQQQFSPAAHALVQAGGLFVGGMVGVLLGPPMARLMIRIVLPRRLRMAVTHLWGGSDQV